MTKDRIETLSKIIPLGGVFIILCSSIKLIIFYGQFNVKITDYLSIGEYATLFVDDTIYYLIIFGVAILLSVFNKSIKESSKADEGDFDFKEFKDERIWIIIISVIVTIGMVILLLIEDSLYFKLDVFKNGIYLLLTLGWSFLLFVKTKYRFSYRSLIITALFFIA
ncbi:MAG: hypothetical protein ACI9EK_002562 [Psychroserpens sp.]|jgi:hypothetical protein